MGYLSRRSDKRDLSQPKASTGIADQHVDEADWSATAHLFTDLGITPPTEAGPEVTSAVDLDPRVRRSRDTGQTYRRQLGWWAGRGGIVIVDQRQPLTVRPDGRYEPSGQWATLSSAFYPTAEPARRRVADFPTNPGSGDPDLQAATSEDHQTYTETVLGLLPEPARRALIQSIAEPLHFSATAIRATFDKPAETVFLVSALRMDAGHATVIYAEHRTGHTTWKSNQINYTFQASTPLLGCGRSASSQHRSLRA